MRYRRRGLACRTPAMNRARILLACLFAVLLSSACSASDALIKPGRGYAVIDSEHLHVLVPAHQVEALKPFVARAEVIYVTLAHDAGYHIHDRLTLLLSDDTEDHNGFSTVTPFPIIDIDLAPATQPSFIFTGEGELERTLTHELTHHLSNDRQFNGFRRVLEAIFGRILPNDVISLIFAYLSTPAHQTMPSFWHEGCAQWAETVYAPAGSPWGGRGRDSLTHMVWRLDAASPEGIPKPADWRITYQRWPFGTRTYLYGMAYLRYLDGAYGDKASIWQLIERQEHRWAFCFDGAPEPMLGKSHGTMIAEAREALAREQAEQLHILASQPITATKRLTPDDSRVSSPAWTRDGKLFAAYDDPFDRPYFSTIATAKDGGADIHKTGWSAYAMGEARSLADGTLVFNETPVGTNPWSRSHVVIVTPDGDRCMLDGKRMLQPDVRKIVDDGKAGFSAYQVTAVRLLPAARQEIVLAAYTHSHGWFSADKNSDWVRVPTEGTPWSPSFRPGHDEMSWVETDAKGSRLVLAPLMDASKRTVLAEVAGRIIHPAWTADGERVFMCSDVSGVCNAYVVDAAHPSDLLPVTNVIGGVIACVPSPDGKELALIDFDTHGPYLARIANDPTTWPKQVPRIELPFPAPVKRAGDRRWAIADHHPAGPATTAGADQGGDHPTADDGAGRLGADVPVFSLPPDRGDPAKLTTHRYHGVLEIRPLFWTPTSLVVPEGGYGVIGAAADKLFTHEIVASFGSGIVDGRAVGLAGYTYGGWPLDISVVGWRSQLLYNDLVVDALARTHDYGEQLTDGEARIGYGLEGFRRRHQAYVAAGYADHRSIRRTEDIYRTLPLISRPPFIGREQYVEATVAYDDSTFFPTSYTREDGDEFAVSWRHSGFGGHKDGDRILGRGTKVITVWPSQSHQIVLGGIVGWSEGDRWLQGEFAVGGAMGTTLPRGYPKTVAVGDYLLAGSGAYRLPIWRPFEGFSTSPFAFRQLVLEGFYDVAKVSPNRIGGQGTWFRSVGGELHAQWEVWYALFNPGLGVAQQLDGDKDLSAYLTLDFGW